MILNMSEAPKDPIQRLVWMTGVKQQVQDEIDSECETLYSRLRMEGRFDAVLAARLHSKGRALALTRRANRARQIRWDDGLDPTSSAYRRSR